MATADQPDPQAIINAVSDVIQNRPLPLREFDQIYMKAGDMVLQTQFVARRFDKKKLGNFDVFYTNPPWGASNEGESVKVFAERGMEAVGRDGEGIIVIADDPELIWARDVLFATQT